MSTILAPKTFKYPKLHRERGRRIMKVPIKSINEGGILVYALNAGTLTSEQVNCLYNILKKKLSSDSKGKEKIKIRFYIFLNLPITKKVIAARMGSGKGSYSNIIVNIAKGKTIFSLGISDDTENINMVKNTIRIINSKMPIKMNYTIMY